MLSLIKALHQEWLLVDVLHPHFLLSLGFIILNPFLWNLLGRLEYHHQLISKGLFGGNRVRACHAFAVLIFCLGLVRDYWY